MNESQQEQYRRIAAAIRFLISSRGRQASLEEIAAAVHYSPFHFQKLFSKYTGVSPKKFQQYLNLRQAQSLLSGAQSLDELSREAGLSGISRLHHLFISLEAMSPDEYRRGGAALQIDYSVQQTPFGHMLVASTTKGICQLAFCIDKAAALSALQSRFPAASFTEKAQELHRQAVMPLCRSGVSTDPLHVHIKGSPFQLKIWEALLKIPSGRLVSYGQVAAAAGVPDAVRATGTAIGANPVAYLIPCHRVIRSSGLLGGYRWGLDTKEMLLALERAQYEQDLALDDEPVVGQRD